MFNSFEAADWNNWNDWEQLEPNYLKSQRAAAFARVGTTDEGAGLWVNQNHMGAAETFGIAADDLMASAR